MQDICRNTLTARPLWGPILTKARIDLLISGHTHKYGIYPKIKGEHEYPIVIGGGPRDTKRTIIRVEVSPKAFELEMLDDQGKVVGSISV